MKITYRRWAIGALAAALLAVLSGCVATVDDGRRGGYGVGYYEPYGQPYGGWPSGYHVAPPRGDRDRDTHSSPAREENRSRKYRPADSSRPVPSLPSKRRSNDHDHDHGN